MNFSVGEKIMVLIPGAGVDAVVEAIDRDKLLCKLINPRWASLPAEWIDISCVRKS